MDYAEQMLTLIAAFRKERGAGLRVEPPTPPGPVPPFGLVQLLFNLLWPDNTSIVLYVVDEDTEKIFTSLILGKRRGDLDLMTTDLYLGEQGLNVRNWRADQIRLRKLVSEKVATPYLACFATLRAWRDWHDADTGSACMKRLRKAGDLILDPFPRRLEVLSSVIRTVSKLRHSFS
jgi:hypothetical protein